VSAAAPEADKRHRLATVPMPRLRQPRLDVSFLLLVLIVALAAPVIVRGLGLDAPQLRDPHAVNLFGNPTGPGGSHPLGVDDEGRDVLSRLLYGLHSLILISLLASALATLASWVLSALTGLGPPLSWFGGRVLAGVRAYPALLLGLALGLSVGGLWRILIPVALVQLRTFSSQRELPSVFARALAGALAIDVGLTFLGVGPGGASPQLGAMIAQAGVGIVAGVPAWWALLFPGLAVLAVLLGAQSLARAVSSGPHALSSGRGSGPESAGPGPARRPRVSENPIVDELIGRLLELVVIAGLAALAFRSLGDANPGGGSALAGIGGDLAATGSLLIGGLVVWTAAVWLHLRLLTRPRRTRTGTPTHSGARPAPAMARRAIAPLATLPAALLVAAPAGWLAFLAIDLFSQSVGSLPVLPGAGTYVGLTGHPAAWAQSLIIPWLLLGLLPAAGTVLALNRRAKEVADCAQQRVARAAGVPEPRLAHQRRRALAAPLLSELESALPAFVATALLIEVSNRIPGVGTAILEAFDHGRPATVADLTLLISAGLIVVGLGLSAARILADPRAARR
jgi:ABC-type dipeptide/oligopeptide/nickel transport system permease subunit